MRVELHAHFEFGFAPLLDLRPLPLDELGVLTGALRIGLRERHVRFFPFLRRFVPMPQFVLEIPTVLCGDRGDELLGSLRLVARARITEQVIAVPGHNESVVKRRLELVLEIGGIQSLGKIVGDPILM
jgi:hypothetical protein